MSAQPSLAAVVSQYDRDKHPGALERLLRTLEPLAADTLVVLVDNAREGDWVHWVTAGLVHVGGDNRAREFSAFDRGLAFLEAEGRGGGLVLLVTDAFRAYGDDYLELVDDQAIEAADALSAAVGWVDSYLQTCRIGDLDYDAWLRTSFLLAPWRVLAPLRPLAVDLERLRIFGDGPERPFREKAAISDNLKGLLLEWLTDAEVPVEQLSERWHSRFRLDGSTFPTFRDKASAILREQVLSARLARAGIPCYDLRCLRRLVQAGRFEGFLAAGGDPALQWLAWRDRLSETRAASRGVAAKMPAGPADGGAPLLLVAEPGEPASLEAAVWFSTAVLPLIRQRRAGARLRVAHPRPDIAFEGLSGVEPGRPEDLLAPRALADCVAGVVPPGSATQGLPELVGRLAGRIELVVSVSVARTLGLSGAELRLCDDSPAALAEACCRLIEDRLDVRGGEGGGV